MAKTIVRMDHSKIIFFLLQDSRRPRPPPLESKKTASRKSQARLAELSTRHWLDVDRSTLVGYKIPLQLY